MIWGGVVSGLLILLFALLLALLLDIQLRLLPLFLIAFVFFTSGTHNRFSFRIHEWRLTPRSSGNSNA